MTFPKCISFTITNKCNLRCQMCGQWSEHGYMQNNKRGQGQELTLTGWQRLVDEIAAHHTTSLLIRGGEPFLFPDILQLLEYIHNKGIFISIDSNGTMLKKYAADLLRIGNIHITISIDGPEQIHDRVRNTQGCFKKIREGLLLLNELEKNSGNKISRSICFTISPYSIQGLGTMPCIARDLAIRTISIVPYYYVPEDIGRTYEKELAQFNCSAFSWRGFHHENSAIEFAEFQRQYREYLANLGDIHNYPYMAFSEEHYQTWFRDATTPVGLQHCSNVERLMDIQPTGEANFCVDFPDYSIGNVRESTIEELWNNSRANAFREYRRKNVLSVCHRCGSKYMSEIAG